MSENQAILVPWAVFASGLRRARCVILTLACHFPTERVQSAPWLRAGAISAATTQRVARGQINAKGSDSAVGVAVGRAAGARRRRLRHVSLFRRIHDGDVLAASARRPAKLPEAGNTL